MYSIALLWAALTFTVASAGAPSVALDSDGDGIPDVDDAAPHDCDGDHDGIPDSVEMGLTAPIGGSLGGDCFVADADPETTTSPTDRDSDGGGMDDGQEDRNHNGRVDDWESDPNDGDDDLDSDQDGLPDVVEGDADPDGDTIPAYLDDDSDGDGLKDKFEGTGDVDDDDLPSFLDLDSDNDGIPDGLDGLLDPDEDGVLAYEDLDSDDDGLPDAVEGAADMDGDKLPNHVDLDSDNDGVPDAVEGLADADCDGHPDYIDVLEDDGFCDTDQPRGAIDDAQFDEPFVPVTGQDPDAFACGCDSSSGPAWWLGVLPVLALLRRRTRAG